MDLEAYRQRLLGRLGRIQFRAAVGGGSGPFSTYYDGRWARDPETLAVVHVESFQQVVSGNSTVAELELGFGVLPVLDISGVLGFRTGNFEYYQHQETVGEPEPEGTPDPRTISTRHIGFRATFAPMPFARVRPIATGAFLIWSGKRVDQLVGLPEPLQTNVFVAPTLSLLELAPGIEADAHEMVSVFGRLGVVVPVAGTREWETSVGEGLARAPCRPAGPRGASCNLPLVRPRAASGGCHARGERVGIHRRFANRARALRPGGVGVRPRRHARAAALRCVRAHGAAASLAGCPGGGAPGAHGVAQMGGAASGGGCGKTPSP